MVSATPEPTIRREQHGGTYPLHCGYIVVAYASELLEVVVETILRLTNMAAQVDLKLQQVGKGVPSARFGTPHATKRSADACLLGDLPSPNSVCSIGMGHKSRPGGKEATEQIPCQGSCGDCPENHPSRPRF